MGKYGQAILTVVGTIVGAYFGFPQLGAIVGSLAGGYLFPPQLPTVSGPRLSDITNTSASVGQPIPRGWGTFPAAGCIIWQGDVREVIESDDVGGKGSPSQTVKTPTYYQDFALGLNDGVIAGVRRIWANGKIVYDRTPLQRISLGDLADETEAAFTQRLAQTEVISQQMTIYLGTSTQDPDPTIEAAEGVGEVSGFRDLAYIMFTNWKCKPEDGNRIPTQWKVECYTDGTESDANLTLYGNEVLYPWMTGDTDPVDARNTNTWGTDSVTYPYSSSSDAIAAYNLALGSDPNKVIEDKRWGWYSNGNNDKIMPTLGDIPNFEGTACHIYYGRFDTSVEKTVVGLVPCETVFTGVEHIISGSGGNPAPGNDHATYQTTPATDNAFGFAPGTQWGLCGGPLHAIWRLADAVIYVRRAPTAPPDPCYAPLPETDLFCLDINGNLVPAGDWELDGSTTYKVLQIYTESGGNVSKYPLSPARPLGHADYNDQYFWEDAYDEAVARGDIGAGLVYGVNYPVTQAFAWRRPAVSGVVVVNRVLIADIITDLSIEAGLTPADLELSDIAALTVFGFVRTRPMSARAAIEPLRAVGLFDGYESNAKIKFTRRGAAPSFELTDDELGVAIQGEDAPSRITTRKRQESELPRRVRVHYISRSRDYEPGQQDSPTRIEVDSVNDLDVEMPVVLEDDEAAQIATIVWADAWASRHLHDVVVDAERHTVEPTDVGLIPVDGRVERMRVVDVTDTFPSIRKFSMVRDDDGSYVSTAVAERPPIRIPPSLQPFSPLEFVLLDLPVLRDEDDDAGVYAAARPLMAGATFRGGQILRSTDGGGNYSVIAQLSSETTMGYLSADAGSGPSTTWDWNTEILVELQGVSTLENRTEAAVIAGANSAAIGAHGRWEIIQFLDAEQVTANLYRLTGLLRGRRGTEWAIGTALEGDRFVMISTGTLSRVPLDLSFVNAELLYKGVATGVTIDSAPVLTFTGAGEALKPFSPGGVGGYRNTSGDLILHWIRRGRIGHTLTAGTDVALNEELEDYEAAIIDSDGNERRVISSLTTAATYTGVQQIVDFGSLQTAIKVRVFQISAAVGRGHYSEATL